MKKYFFVFFIIMLVSGTYAQEFKLIIGSNYSKYGISQHIFQDEWGSEYENKISSKNGFLFGGGIEFAFNENMAIEIDALYFQKGSDYKLFREGVYYGKKRNYILNVISFPILLKIKFFRASSPYILGGCEFSLILTHESRETYDLLEVEQHYEDNLKDKSKGTDFGVIYGGGFEIKMPVVSIFIEGRSSLGLRNIAEHYLIDLIKTRSVMIIIGLKI